MNRSPEPRTQLKKSVLQSKATNIWHSASGDFECLGLDLIRALIVLGRRPILPVSQRLAMGQSFVVLSGQNVSDER